MWAVLIDAAMGSTLQESYCCGAEMRCGEDEEQPLYCVGRLFTSLFGANHALYQRYHEILFLRTTHGDHQGHCC